MKALSQSLLSRSTRLLWLLLALAAACAALPAHALRIKEVAAVNSKPPRGWDPDAPTTKLQFL